LFFFFLFRGMWIWVIFKIIICEGVGGK